MPVTTRNAARSAIRINALPDEILVMILSDVATAQPGMLLESLPLVCLRWHRLAKDRKVWQDVDVAWSAYSGARDSLAPFPGGAARLLLCAPSLANLTVDTSGGSCVRAKQSEEERRFVSALRRTKAVVRNSVRVVDDRHRFARDGDLVDSVLGALGNVLERSGHCLRALSLPIMRRLRCPRQPKTNVNHSGSSNVNEARRRRRLRRLARQQLSVFAAVARLPALERLELRCPSSSTPYRGELHGASLPRLRELVVETSTIKPQDAVGPGGLLPGVRRRCAAAERLLVDLLSAGATTLRDATVDSLHGVASHAVVDAVAACSGLRSVALHSSAVEAVGSLPSLRHASVRVWDRTGDPQCGVLRRALHVLAAHRGLRSVRLEVSTVVASGIASARQQSREVVESFRERHEGRLQVSAKV